MHKVKGELKIIIKKVAKYYPLIFLLLPLFFLPFEWYKNLVIIPEDLIRGNADGFLVLTNQSCQILIIYLFCIIIQYMAISSKHYIFAFSSEIFLIILLTLFPANYYDINIFTSGFGFYFLSQFLYYGYYLTAISLLVSVVMNIVLFKNRNLLK